MRTRQIITAIAIVITGLSFLSLAESFHWVTMAIFSVSAIIALVGIKTTKVNQSNRA